MTIQQIFMKRALQLAEQGRGYTSPNPMVGAVIVRGERIIGEGFHARAGDKHAEIVAIENAIEAVEGADIYCNLEPCCHETPGKRTPPCTLRLIQERISRVFISTQDPNPHVSGKGVTTLRHAGIDVEVGLLSERAARLNEVFFKFIQTRRPFIHLKIAMTLDGRIATHRGDSRWISDADARRQVHAWRHAYDAVLVGATTALVDNPQLTVRHQPGRQPLRLVLDSRLRIPLECELLQDEHRHLSHIFTTTAADRQKQLMIEAQGAYVHRLETDKNGRVSLPAVLDVMGKMGITSVLVEGGSAIYTAFVENALFDKLSVFIAPILIGDGIAALGDLHKERITEALQLQQVRYKTINSQILVEGYRDLNATFGSVSLSATAPPISSTKKTG